MAELGGHFAVAYFSEKILHDAVDAGWRVLWHQLDLPVTWSAPTPAGEMLAQGRLSADRPALTLDPGINGLRVVVAAAGRVEVTIGDLAVGNAFVEARASIAAPIALSQQLANNPAKVDLSGLTFQPGDIAVTWMDGVGDPIAETALRSPAIRDAIAVEVRRRLDPLLTFRLPMDKVWLAELALMTRSARSGTVVLTPMIKLGGIKILPGWVAIGIDATSGIGQTSGVAAAIGPPPDAPPPAPSPMPLADLGDQSIRIIIDPAHLLTYLQANAKLAMRVAAALRPGIHPSDAVSIGFDDDAIVIRASGTVDAPDPFPGRMPFTATLRVTPFIPKNTHTVYVHIKPDVHVDAPWFLDVLGDILDFFGGDVFAALRRVNKTETAILFGAKTSFPIEDAGGFDLLDLSARVQADRIVVRPDLIGIYGEGGVHSWASGPGDDLRAQIYDDIGIRRRWLTFALLPYRLVRDPNYLIRYTVKRGSNSEPLATGRTWSGTSERFGGEVDMWDDSTVLETSYVVDLVTERPPGHPLATHTATVTVHDKFDRSSPYVRWNKKHFDRAGVGQQPRIRVSAIHRTAIRERCAFGDDLGRSLGPRQYTMQRLDSLPAPEEDGLSSKLCPYCFPGT
ncbi:hypothetical protein F6B41_01435 [Microbacterium lushaniae]|nr:hypothetical protein F6B41_02190 [Microbacterium lushaniae]KAA9159142.1 hypothetical protein F6B41_01435 [Microbacterium lushaniae]